MTFLEGAVLVVGGVFLVSYMAKRNTQPSVGPYGFSNASNLTTVGNPSGGNVVAGEPLTPPINPPLQPVSVYSPQLMSVYRPSVGPITAKPQPRFMAL